MPKVSEEHKEGRRREILDAARRCFARHGYEGATVARLEEESGLSRGAIFNYFPNKEALFVEVIGSSIDRMTELWLDRGFRELLEAITLEDPDWLGVMLEATARLRTDAKLRELVEAKEAEQRRHRGERFARLKEQGIRDDLPVETVAIFLSLIANGLAFRRAGGEPMPDVGQLARLVETGVAPREEVSRARRPRKTGSSGVPA